MAGFRIRQIAETIANQARETLRSPQYGHPAHVEVATGYGPCRLCLHTFNQGSENRILFTYNPFEGLDSYPSPGPIFIHEEKCSPYSAVNEFPADLRNLKLVFEAYGPERQLVLQERIRDGAVEAAIARMFDQATVEYIHVRNGEAGCFIAHIERA
jgi:uncharacterized protein DUF1203